MARLATSWTWDFCTWWGCLFSYQGPCREITLQQGRSKLPAHEGRAGMWHCFPRASDCHTTAAQGTHPECVCRAGELKNELKRCGPAEQRNRCQTVCKYWKIWVWGTLEEESREDLVGKGWHEGWQSLPGYGIILPRKAQCLRQTRWSRTWQGGQLPSPTHRREDGCIHPPKNSKAFVLALYTLHTNISNHQGIPQRASGKINICLSISLPRLMPSSLLSSLFSTRLCNGQALWYGGTHLMISSVQQHCLSHQPHSGIYSKHRACKRSRVCLHLTAGWHSSFSSALHWKTDCFLAQGQTVCKSPPYLQTLLLESATSLHSP